MNTAIDYQLTSNTPQPARNIAEVIIPEFTESSSIILPIVASMTQQQASGWTTWVTPDMPSKTALESLGADLSRLRIVHVNNIDDARWIIWQALAQGNSHTVIAEQSVWNTQDVVDMEVAALKGNNTTGILVTRTKD